MKAEKQNQIFKVCSILETPLLINLINKVEDKEFTFNEVMEFVDMIIAETGYAYKKRTNKKLGSLKFVCAFQKFISDERKTLPRNSKSLISNRTGKDVEVNCLSSLQFKLKKEDKSNYKGKPLYYLLKNRRQHIHLPPNVSLFINYLYFI